MVKRLTSRMAWGLAAVIAGGAGWCFSHRKPPSPDDFRQSIREDFRRNLHQREEVVALARAGRLAPPDPSEDQHFKGLPFRYRHLSDGGEVYVVHPSGSTTVEFYTFRGLLTGGWSAFYYVAEDLPPFQGEHQEKMAPHWYWVSSRN